MTRTIEWEPETSALVLSQNKHILRSRTKHLEYHVDSAEVEDVVLSDLRTALMAARSSLRTEAEVNLTVSHPNRDAAILNEREQRQELLSVEYRDQHIVFFELDDHDELTLALFIDYAVARTETEVSAIVQPLLAVKRSSLALVDYRNAVDVDSLEIRITMDSDWRIRQALELSETLRYALRFSKMDPRSAQGAYLSILSGHPEAILGQPESIWLEVKQAGYDLQTEREKHEFAVDLAALANTNSGALLVVGYKTERNDARQDILTEVVGCTAGSIVPDVYAQVVRSRIVPQIEGLEFHLVSYGNRNLFLIRVPAQSDFQKPFIVRGGLTAGGHVNGASFTIPHRVGDSRWNLTPEAVHSLLVAARLALENAAARSVNE